MAMFNPPSTATLLPYEGEEEGRRGGEDGGKEGEVPLSSFFKSSNAINTPQSPTTQTLLLCERGERRESGWKEKERERRKGKRDRGGGRERSVPLSPLS